MVIGSELKKERAKRCLPALLRLMTNVGALDTTGHEVWSSAIYNSTSEGFRVEEGFSEHFVRKPEFHTNII